MAFLGNAMLVIWNGVNPEVTSDYDRWITEEHIPERMSAPGFLRGRRYVAPNPGSRQPYLNMYELSDIGDCTSSAYLAMLQSPSAWTQTMMPHLRDFSRAAMHTLRSSGAGVGGCIGSVQLRAPDAPAGRDWLGSIDGFLPAGVVGVHVGAVDAAAAGGLTPEKTLRGSKASEADFTHVVLIESVDENAMSAAITAVSERLAKAFHADAVVGAGVYRLNLIL
ncbi:MAG: hypothetical protein J0H09_24095 [Burkholderiales bacterium]|nr:hypothetical protein [Burkholderiales bacterium]ODU56535.1 MAG: hypothetical protein ABS99_05765 [Acetobacteraceae bacterium SCN 69-10]